MFLLSGNQIYLRPLVLEDVNEEYLAWMNDYEVTKYTESRFSANTKQAVEEFVRGANNMNNHTFAIIAKDKDKHIGNIKLGGINWIHRYGDIGLIIGDKEYHGKGIGTEAIKLISEYAFHHLNLHKVWCGLYEPNIGSMRAFQKAGFEVLAKYPKHCYFEGDYIDCIYLHKMERGGV